MSPPELTGYAPVSDVFQPVEIDLFKPFRNMGKVAFFGGFYGRSGQFFHLHEPLVGKHWFYYCMTSVTFAYRDNFFFGLYQISGGFKVCYPGLTAFVAVHALIFSGQFVHGGVFVYAAGPSQTRSDTYLEVVRVMGRRDLDGAGTFFRIRIFIFYDRDLLAHQRQDHFLSYQMFVPVVFRIYGNGFVGEHGLRS